MRRAALLRVAVCACFLVVSIAGYAGEIPNFSGTYRSTQKPKKGSVPEKIIVSQTADLIEITRVAADGKPNTNRFRLDGSLGDYVAFSGVHGNGRALWKDKYLRVENTLTGSAQGSPPITFHMTERWQLSPDGNLLTIKSDLDCPGQQQICSMAFNGFPMTEKYLKNQQP